MTTALDMIKRSLRMLGVYSAGETPTPEESQDALHALNTMMESWATENLFIYAQSTDSIPFVTGTQSRTIGATGDYITTRPVEVLQSSYILYQNVSYPLSVATLTDYNQIPVKTLVSGIPVDLYVLAGYPNITATVWPIPSADMTLVLESNKLIQSFATLTDVVALPPGYERAIVYSLAEELADDYQVAVPVNMAKKAAQGRRNIKRINVQIPRLSMPVGVPMGNSFVSWRTGT